MEQADRALYAAKRRGRNRVLLASEITESDLVAERPEAIRIARGAGGGGRRARGAPAEHPADVASLAARIARALQLDSRTALRCELGGWLHDIGKLASRARSCTSRRALDDEEWAIMRRHPELGERIVERIAALHAAGARGPPPPRAVRRQRLPGRPAGNAIPIEARIVAAADAYSAMTQSASTRRRAAPTRRCTSSAAAPARNSTPSSSTRCSSGARGRGRRRPPPRRLSARPGGV